ncbi:hypothetical protein A2U01_0082019 [Trifolium medium]|uniref:Uncharacterized protein n=1 Tax=Trifolium medium TaxID=97028 RepID=A0A392TI10_9FABA|nr:hypothetical protein [Trifolium medium]
MTGENKAEKNPNLAMLGESWQASRPATSRRAECPVAVYAQIHSKTSFLML